MKSTYADSFIVQKLGIKQAAVANGWTRSLAECVEQLEAEVEALEARLGVSSMWEDATPCSYAGKRVFTSEGEAPFSLNVYENQAGPLSTVKYILRDGVTYDIPIMITGPGAFVVEHIVTTCELINSTRYIKDQPSYFNQTSHLVENQLDSAMTAGPTAYYAGPPAFELPLQSGKFYSTKFCINNGTPNTLLGPSWEGNQPKDLLAFYPSAARYTLGPPNGVVNKTQTPYLGFNYFWNLIDSKSGFKLSNDLMSAKLLGLPSRVKGSQYGAASQDSLFYSFNKVGDGNLFTLDVPLVVERDGQLNFLFRAINPILQLAATDPNNIAGKEDQKVSVQVELHGYRLNAAQDYLRMGAISR